MFEVRNLGRNNIFANFLNANDLTYLPNQYCKICLIIGDTA